MEEESKTSACEESSKKFIPFDELPPAPILIKGRYRHFKTGGVYTLLSVARKAEAPTKYTVVYEGAHGDVWVRDYEDFISLVDGEPRFKFLPPIYHFKPWRDITNHAGDIMGSRRICSGVFEDDAPGFFIDWRWGFALSTNIPEAKSLMRGEKYTTMQEAKDVVDAWISLHYGKPEE